VTRRTKGLVGLLILGSVALWSPEAATSAPAACGRPEDAPGFETPARTGVVPNVVCMDLQEAQDTLQSAGFYTMTSRDASGRGRRQVVDRDWTVTGQTPSPGGTYRKTTEMVLRAVKDGEPSPC
jgi:hypothetical protein